MFCGCAAVWLRRVGAERITVVTVTVAVTVTVTSAGQRMSEMNAHKILAELALRCESARRFYARKLRLRGGDLCSHVLARGAADFDCPLDPADENEKPHYRSSLYISAYMKMHLAHNLAVLRRAFRARIPQPAVWVDYGCGPMTAGLALAKILAEKNPAYKNTTAYFGVDASAEMVKKARYINQSYELFAPQNFCVMQSAQLHARVFDAIAAMPLRPAAVVLCCSFTLAPGTWKTPGGYDARALAAQWKHFAGAHACRDSRVLYLNPRGNFHANWRAFRREMLRPSHSTLRYTGGEICSLPMPPPYNPIAYALIRARRR